MNGFSVAGRIEDMHVAVRFSEESVSVHVVETRHQDLAVEQFTSNARKAILVR
jgi:hypothetical protein